MEQRNDMKHRLYLVGHPLGQWNPQFYFLYIHNLALWKVSSISIVSSTAYVPVTGEGNGTPLQYSCLENPMDGGARWAAVHAVPKSWAQLSDFTFTFPFHALEKEMATHSSVLAWRIPGTGEPGGLPSMGSHRVGHDWSDLAAAAAAHCRQHNDVSLSYRDINVSYLFDKWSICGWEQADKVSRKDCRIEGFVFF